MLPARIPPPRLRSVRNLTPFRIFDCDKMGKGRRFYDTIVVKASCRLEPGVSRIADEHAPIVYGDEHWDLLTLGRSSLKRPGDVVLVKGGTDIFVTGSARAPGGRPAARWEAAVAVRGASGPVCSLGLIATGARRWQHRAITGWRLSDPEPTATVPIRYELAYGGAYPDRERIGEWILCEANPCGRGFVDTKALDKEREYDAPQWEGEDHPVKGFNDGVPLAGFGPIARAWSSRLRHLGTCDGAWKAKNLAEMELGLPADYPADFDIRYFNCAHPSLRADDYLRGDEYIGLSGLTGAQGNFVTQLPGVAIKASLHNIREEVERRMLLDTVHIDLDASAIHLCWRLTIDHEEDRMAAVVWNEELEA